MGLYDFIKEAGKSIGLTKGEPTADELKKELDTHKLGTENVIVQKDGDKAIIRGSVSGRDVLEKAVVAIGNTIGVSKVETDVHVANAEASPSTMYTVKKGDTLSEIAEAIYGKGHASHSKQIFEANRPMLKSANKIYPGQVLRIPPLEHRAAA